MHICMKATGKEVASLRRRIASAVKRSGLNYSEIGRLARVDPSQVSRVVRGDFKTVSNNVVQICRVLGLKLETVSRPAQKADAAWSRLEASVRRLCDDNPNSANRIAHMLDTIADLRNRRPTG